MMMDAALQNIKKEQILTVKQKSSNKSSSIDKNKKKTYWGNLITVVQGNKENVSVNIDLVDLKHPIKIGVVNMTVFNILYTSW